MKGFQTALAIMRADLRNRTKKDSFWVIIAMSVVITSFFIPAEGARYLTVSFEEYRGIYNSAWVGTVAAMTISWCLGLLGFYLVKDNIEVDEETRVGQLITASPVQKVTYLFGKFLSNVTMLSLIMAISMVVAILLQIIRGESYEIQLLNFIVPFGIIIWPALIFVSALAVLFQTVPILKGATSNIVFFFIFSMTMVDRVWSMRWGELTIPLGDLFANNTTIQAMRAIAYQQIPNYTGRASYGFIFQQNPTQTFVFTGVEWSVGMVLGRLMWVLGAIMVIYLAALVFRGFDSTSRDRGEQGLVSKLTPMKGKSVTFMRRRPSTGLLKTSDSFAAIRLLIIETKLMIKGRPLWWYVITAGLIVLSLLGSTEIHRYLLPILWLWPISMFSPLGVREFQDNTVQLILSGNISVRKHLLTVWLSGVIVAAAIGSGVGVRMLASGDWKQALALLVGALFIPAMALCLGVFTRTRRVFEVVYFLIWYMGPLNGIWFLDFMGASYASWSLSLFYLGLTGALLIVSLVTRRHQFATLFA